MSRQKEIEEFLELDKDNIELVEGIASCHAEYGRAEGELRGRSYAWREAVDLAMALHNLGKIDSPTLAKFTEPFFRAVKAADRKHLPRRKETLTAERATWKVLKRRLARKRTRTA